MLIVAICVLSVVLTVSLIAVLIKGRNIKPDAPDYNTTTTEEPVKVDPGSPEKPVIGKTNSDKTVKEKEKDPEPKEEKVKEWMNKKLLV